MVVRSENLYGIQCNLNLSEEEMYRYKMWVKSKMIQIQKSTTKKIDLLIFYLMKGEKKEEKQITNTHKTNYLLLNSEFAKRKIVPGMEVDKFVLKA